MRRITLSNAVALHTGKENVKYKGPIHAAKTIVAEEGVAALWKGNLPTMARQGINQVRQFITVAELPRHC